MNLPSDAVAQRAYLKENWSSVLHVAGAWPGAAISLRTAFGEYLPLSLAYQFAYRFDDGLPPLHQVVLAVQ